MKGRVGSSQQRRGDIWGDTSPNTAEKAPTVTKPHHTQKKGKRKTERVTPKRATNTGGGLYFHTHTSTGPVSGRRQSKTNRFSAGHLYKTPQVRGGARLSFMLRRRERGGENQIRSGRLIILQMKKGKLQKTYGDYFFGGTRTRRASGNLSFLSEGDGSGKQEREGQ